MSGARNPQRSAGRPLLALGGLLLCWIGVRAAFFDMPRVIRLPEGPTTGINVPSRFVGIVSRAGSNLAGGTATGNQIDVVRGGAFVTASTRSPSLAAVPGRDNFLSSPAPSLLETALSALAPTPHRLAAGPNLLSMAAIQGNPLPAGTAMALRGAAIPAGRAPDTAPASPSRWSGDGWIALRQGGAAPALGNGTVPLYGASQVGAVLRYRLAPGSSPSPAAYVRVVGALGSTMETDLAAGLSARLAPSLPVTAHAEARLARRKGSEVELRPAAFVAAGFDEARLAYGVKMRGYAQAGYVGGRDATGFADGSLVADRDVMSKGNTALSAGAGLWGGAQRGAARLDIGPSGSLRFRLGEGTGRITVDYRLRVAGNAEPASGAALTLSAGF